MATKTTNYGLAKPEYSEAADISVINANMDTLDAELKKVSDKTTQATDLAGKPDGYATLGADGKVPASQLPETAACVPIAGGTMTGPLILSGAPERDLQAATKRYVDDAASKIAVKHDTNGYYIEA